MVVNDHCAIPVIPDPDPCAMLIPETLDIAVNSIQCFQRVMKNRWDTVFPPSCPLCASSHSVSSANWKVLIFSVAVEIPTRDTTAEPSGREKYLAFISHMQHTFS